MDRPLGTGRGRVGMRAGTGVMSGEWGAETARRELAEEAGLKAGRLTRLGRAYLVPGYGDELMTWFLAEDLAPTPSHAEMDESFKVNPFDRPSLRVLRQNGELEDAKTFLGLAWAGVELL